MTDEEIDILAEMICPQDPNKINFKKFVTFFIDH